MKFKPYIQKTSKKLATAQGSSLTNYGKIQLYLVPTWTLEQNKLLDKPLLQIFHLTAIKRNIVGVPFITKSIPTINILNSRLHIKEKYTKQLLHPYFFSEESINNPHFSQNSTLKTQQRKHLKHFQVMNVTSLSVKYITKKLIKIYFFKCLTLNLNQFIICLVYHFHRSNTNSNLISLHVYNNSLYNITLPLGISAYCESNATKQKKKQLE